MNDQVLLEAEDLSKFYGGVTALEEVDIRINENSVHCLVGENGSGKSTLVKIITGVVQPEPGAKINFQGNTFSSLKPIDAYRKGIQVVHQDLSLFPKLSIAENIGIGQYIEPGRVVVNWQEQKEMAEESLSRLDVSFDVSKPVRELSKADQQLIAIARALASDAKLLIMDEPTASLTQEEVNELFGIINELTEKGVSILFISHRLEEVLEIGDQITVLRDGNKISTVEREEVSKRKLSRLMTGEKVQFTRYLEELENREPVLELDDVSREGEYQGIDLSVARGEVVGIIGPLGSGQTKLARSLFGMNPPSSGRIFLEGKEVELNTISQAMDNGIGYVPEDRLTQGLVLEQTIEDNLILTDLDKFSQNLFNLIDRGKQEDFVDNSVETYDIKIGQPGDRVISLSGGNQQKIVVAKWVSVEPRLLILNRPTHGVDIAAKDNIYRLIADLVSEGMGIILISDEAEEVINNSHRIRVMKRGNMTHEISPSEIDEDGLYQVVLEDEEQKVS
ncbi:MAG: sugar ABC transporter ATP-binding protein [Candidatus Bipolaricaulota bacterium]